jgi:hypothetical protein
MAGARKGTLLEQCVWLYHVNNAEIREWGLTAKPGITGPTII